MRKEDKPTEKVERKPYSKPEVIHRQPLEAIASDCTGSLGKEEGLCFIPGS